MGRLVDSSTLSPRLWTSDGSKICKAPPGGKVAKIRSWLKRQLSRSAWTRLGTLLHPRPLLVLCYHDLREDDGFSSWLRVRKSDFEAQLALLKSMGYLIGPNELFEQPTGSSKAIRFLITFDDGYANSFRIGLPILQRLQIPVVYFVSTEPMTTGRMFWHDKIIFPIQALRLMELDLRELGLRKYTFPERDDAQRWTKIQLLLEDLKGFGNADQPIVASVLETLQTMAIQGGVWGDFDTRPLDESQVTRMADNQGCYIGSHGHEHNILTFLDPESLRTNLRKSKDILERITRREITLFAYPNGSVNETVVRSTREAGFLVGFTTASGRVCPDTHRYLVPRLMVGGYDTVETLRLKINSVLIAGTKGN